MGKILITGADGYLGRRLVRRLLQTTDAELVLAVRARHAADLAAEQSALTTDLAGFESRVAWAAAALETAEPFAGVDGASVTAILHGAAVTRFNVDAETARRVNVDGTRKLLSFARRCPGLERLVLLSTVYASGLRGGTIAETDLDGTAGFANQYERSKWESERLLGDASFADLPWRICRVATVVADDESGRVSQQNAVHNTLKLLYHGLLSLVPGCPDVPVYFVTGEFAVEATLAALRAPVADRVFHACHTRAESLGLGELIDVAFTAFEREEAFRARRILKPLFADAESFDRLVGAVQSFGGGIAAQAVSSVAPFARQLFVAKSVENGRLQAAMPGYRAPDAKELMRRTCASLVRTRWGRA